MRLVSLDDVEHPPAGKFLARPLIDGDGCNVRIIRLAAGAALPPHRHGTSELMLYAAEGAGELETPEGVRPFGAGGLAHYRGDEELVVRNTGSAELVLLAFLAPRFPPA